MKYYEKTNMKTLPVEESVGKMLLHDITMIVPDLFKGAAFRKGHIITEADVEKLLDMGKKHIYVSDMEGEVHENEASLRVAKASLGDGISISDPKEGKVGFTAQHQGLLKVNVQGLEELNSVPEIIFATLHTDQPVRKGQELAGTRIIPLSINDELVVQAEEVCRKYYPIINIKPFAKFNIGIVVTGSEVYSRRIEDGFGPVVQKKFEELGSTIVRKEIVSDELDMTVSAIKGLMADGADMIAVTGGMSVDPDDLTPAAIRAAGGRIVSYGSPVLPGAMFMLSYVNHVPIIGLPGCVMYHRASIFDLVVPKILAGEEITKKDIVKMGHGGFCSSCKTCRFPICSFGK